MSWLAPAFLLGMVAVGLPLWLHRLSSENPNRQPFSSVMFLEPGEPRRVLARRLQYWLLLALRIAVIALAALAFAGPELATTRTGTAGDTAELHVLVIDGSASMSLGSRWARMREAALEVIDGLGAADQAELVLAGRRLELLASASSDRAELRQRINALEPTLYHIDYGQTMLALDGLLRSVELPVVLDFITDAQQSSLPTRFADLAPRRPMALVIHDVGADDEQNWSIDALTGSVRDGTVTATIAGHDVSAAEKTVVLERNGEAVARQNVEVPADGNVDVELGPIDLVSGPNRLRLRLEPGDALAADDQRFLVLERAEPRPVLLIAADPRGNDTLYLSEAMGTLDDLALNVDRESAGALTERSLGDYAFIVVADAGVLDDAAERALADYVEAGGALWLGFGPRASTLTEVPVTGQRLQGFVQGGAASNAPGVTVGAIETEHPGLADTAELRRARITRYVTIVPGDNDDVPIRLEDGTPLLVDTRLGAGRVLLFASSLDRQWNDLPVAPVFVPFVAGLSRYLAGATGGAGQPRLGDTLSLSELGLGAGQIFDPSGEPALGLAGSAGTVLLEQTGFYAAEGRGETKVVAVNLDPAESDITRVDAAELERWRALSRPGTPAAAGAAPGAAGPESWPIWPWLLGLLVLAAVMESVVGNWHLRVRRGIAT